MRGGTLASRWLGNPLWLSPLSLPPGTTALPTLPKGIRAAGNWLVAMGMKTRESTPCSVMLSLMINLICSNLTQSSLLNSVIFVLAFFSAGPTSILHLMKTARILKSRLLHCQFAYKNRRLPTTYLHLCTLKEAWTVLRKSALRHSRHLHMK